MTSEQRIEILVVDDDAGHVELVRRNLRRAGINNSMSVVTSGRAALDYIFREGEFVSRANTNLLVLLDINMPGGVDGVEVLRRIKADPERSRIPVIMLTTTDDPREIDRCYTLGCNVYIVKPVDPTAFIEAVARLGLFVSVVSIPEERGVA